MSALESVESGDYLVVSNRYGNAVVAVERTTATQIVLANGDRYSKCHGYRVPRESGWVRTSIHVPADGEIEKIRRERRAQRLLSELRTTDWQEVTEEKREKIYKILKQ